ncbi:MAG: WhiB family transcriptional regulator [Acidimicrobiia bacterium]
MALSWQEAGLRDPDGWRLDAACRHVDPDLFFPSGTARSAADHIEAAKAVCRACPVRVPCLDFALTSHQDAGIWGGASEEERRALRAGRLHLAG